MVNKSIPVVLLKVIVIEIVKMTLKQYYGGIKVSYLRLNLIWIPVRKQLQLSTNGGMWTNGGFLYK